MKAVLDTNVLISSLIATGIPHEIVLKGYNGEFQIVVSLETVTELRETLAKYPDRFQLDDQAIQTEVETLQYVAEFVEPDESITAVDRDPDDDKFLEAAVAGDVEYIVSGDQLLLDLGSFREIDIVEPRTFYECLESQ